MCAIPKGASKETIKAEFTSLMADKHESIHEEYTDGSLKDDKVGFVFVTNNQIIKIRTRSQSSIYSSKQQAIITAMESTTRTNEPIIIATDSLLAASGNRWTRNPRNIRRLLDNSRNHIKLIWVLLLSHVGISGNEAADQAAKDALNVEIGNQ
jgi:ribonuclease HI